jgi:hypothetical protein
MAVETGVPSQLKSRLISKQNTVLALSHVHALCACDAHDRPHRTVLCEMTAFVDLPGIWKSTSALTLEIRV